MFGFGKRSSKNPAALVAQQQQPNGRKRPESAPLQRFGKDDHRNFSVLESVDGDGVVLIGKGTSVVGEIGNCSKVEIQGHLEGSIVAESIVVGEGGSIRGGLHVVHAEVQGFVDGDVLVEDLLEVRSTGRVNGEVAYGKLAVEAGGDIVGAIRGSQEVPQDAEPQHEGVNAHTRHSNLDAPSNSPANAQMRRLNRQG